MDMDKAMMMRFHGEMYMLHNELAHYHHKMHETQKKIAQGNYNMYAHMLNHSENHMQHAASNECDIKKNHMGMGMHEHEHENNHEHS
jgi:hypothetical protein